ncbi:MAG: hypothetical protein HPY53_12505 [Brevinematales bacterium]|nr:hypothetical protein [Brevinematales bacterium]
MSIRVYAIVGFKGRTPEYDERFNYYSDEAASKYLETSEEVNLRQFYDGDGSGEAVISIQGLRELLNLVEEDQKAGIQSDIDYALKEHEDSVTYYLF